MSADVSASSDFGDCSVIKPVFKTIIVISYVNLFCHLLERKFKTMKHEIQFLNFYCVHVIVKFKKNEIKTPPKP